MTSQSLAWEDQTPLRRGRNSRSVVIREKPKSKNIYAM